MAQAPKPSFFFYDLETSGINPRRHRVMQFAGQRTDMDLNPIDEPVNIYVALADDVLPDPEAIMITGITPQKTLEEGYSEAEFCRILMEEICTAGTIITGFNNIRFDDEFIRHTLYRNFYDPYEWAWADGRSRWDLLDVVRATRALRPDGISWPVDEKGNATNRLELLTKANGIVHESAHDAMSDVYALIAVTRLIKDRQPKLYSYMLEHRDKKSVQRIVSLENPKPFVYTSGRYAADHQKTTVALPIAPGMTPGTVLVYDLRSDPKQWQGASDKAIADVAFADYSRRQEPDFIPFPVKELAYNKCPAVSPLGVLDEATLARLDIDLELIQQHLKLLSEMKGFGSVIRSAYEMRSPFAPNGDVDARLYDKFMDPKDKPKLSVVRAAKPAELKTLKLDFHDERLDALLVRYKARNFSNAMDDADRKIWEEYRTERIKADLPKYIESLNTIGKSATNAGKQFLLSELQFWAESIAPDDLS